MQIRDVGGRDIAAWRQRLVDLYAETYTEPPWLESPEQLRTFADRLDEHAQRPGFRCEVEV